MIHDDDFWEAEEARLAGEEDPDGAAIWVNPKTGEIVPPGTKGAMLVEAIFPEQEDRIDSDPDEDWLPDYFTERVAEWAAKEALLIKQHERRLAQLRADRRGFEDYYAARVETIVRRQAEQQKRRSVDYAFGRLGFRKSCAKFEVEDKDQAIEWAKANAPEAVKVETKESLLKSNLPGGASIPGARWVPEHDKFYVDVKAGS